MQFAHDTEVALEAAAALVNTGHETPDALGDVDQLAAFVRLWGWTGETTGEQSELELVHGLRPRLEQVWRVDADDAVDIVNGMLRDGRALPQLVRHDEWDYHLHATAPDAPLADRMAVEASLALTDLIRAGELGRLGTCAAGDCTDVMVDLTKNRSRRFCSSTCANRTNVAAFRARRTRG